MPALPILAGRPEPNVLRTAHGVPRAIERRPKPPLAEEDSYQAEDRG
jgi:hypothetical protein